jgi:hypothetical protein
LRPPDIRCEHPQGLQSDTSQSKEMHAMFSPIVPSFFRIFFIKKWKSSPFSAVHRL